MTTARWKAFLSAFFASLKKEFFYRREYDTIDDVERNLFNYIEVFYNRKRLHSSLGYMTRSDNNEKPCYSSIIIDNDVDIIVHEHK